MKLRTRLFLASSAITVATTLAIGLLSLNDSYNLQLAQVDSTLNEAAAVTSASSVDTVTAAIDAASVAGEQIAVILIDTNGDLNEIAGPADLVTKAPTGTTLIDAENNPVTVNAKLDYRLRTVVTLDGSIVLFAKSIRGIQLTQMRNLQFLALALLAALVIALSATALMVRRDIRAIEKLAAQAKQIADGEDVEIPRVKTRSEVGVLSESIASMVQSLKASIVKQRRAQTAMQQFLGDASHELRTPLTVIRGYSELLTNPKADKKLRDRSAHRVVTEVDRMEKLVNDLLFLAEVGETRELTKATLNFSELVAETVSDLKLLNPERRVTTKIEKGLTVRGSATHLARLLGNIFSNIRRHTSPTTKVSVKLESKGRKLILTVEDAGPGLPTEVLARGIDDFDRFVPFADKTHGGSGLGMTIMRSIAQSHGGNLELYAGSLGGLGVRVELPKSAKPKSGARGSR